MNKNFKRIVSTVLLLAMVLSVIVVVPASAEDLSPLPDATANYTSGVFIACRTVDEAGNPTNLALYGQNQKVIFELIAYDKDLNKLKAFGFNYSIKADGSGDTVVDSGFAEADPATGIALVETTTMNQPGLLRIEADIANAEKETLTAYRPGGSTPLLQGGVLVNAQSIKTYADVIPADEMRQVWNAQLELQVAPTVEKITKLSTSRDSTFDTYAIYISSIGDTTDITRPSTWNEGDYGPESGETWAAAYMTVPKNAAKSSLDVQIGFQGYGVNSPTPGYNNNKITVNICAHSVELLYGTDLDFEDYYIDWIKAGSNYGFDVPSKGFVTNDQLETCYFRNMLLRNVNVLKFVLEAFGTEGATLVDDYDENASRTLSVSEFETVSNAWKGLLKTSDRQVNVSGGSQGGFQAIGMAALLPDVVTYCNSSITWMADTCGGTKYGTSADRTDRITGSFRPVPSKATGAERSAIEYCDSANLAQLVECKTYISTAGIGDLTSPPTGVMAMYNNLTRGKDVEPGYFSINFVQGRAHGYPASYTTEVQNFHKTYSTAVINAALETKVSSWNINGTTLTINAEGILDATTGAELWNADPAYANVNSIVLSEGIISLEANAFNLAAENVTVKMPSTLEAIAENAFGSADLKNYTIRSYNGSYGQTFANVVEATFDTLGDISASGMYSYTVDGDTLNIVSTGDTSVLTADSTLVALAVANAEAIKNIEIEGKFAAVGSLSKALARFTRVESIMIDSRSDTIELSHDGVFANAASLTSFGHIDFDASGASIENTGTFKKNLVSLKGFNAAVYGATAEEIVGIFENCRSIIAVEGFDGLAVDDPDLDGAFSGVTYGEYTNCISLETVTVYSSAILANAFNGATALKNVYLKNVDGNATFDFTEGQFDGTSGVTFIVESNEVAGKVQTAIEDAGLNAIVSVGETGLGGDKTGSAGASATWTLKGNVLVISGSGTVTSLAGLSDTNKEAVNTVVITGTISSIEAGVIAGMTLEKVKITCETLPEAADGVFGEQSGLTVYVSPSIPTGETLYGYPVKADGVLQGDLNRDSKISGADAVLLAQVVAGWNDLEYSAGAADCNGDDTVDINDRIKLAQYLAGWSGIDMDIVVEGGEVELPGDDLVA